MKTSLPHLRQVVNAALQVALAGAGSVTLAGCGGVEPGIEGDPHFDGGACEGAKRAWLPGLTPAMTTEYQELRLNLSTEVETLGTKCGGASDHEQCLMSFDALEGSQFDFGQQIQAVSTAQLLATQGDDTLLVGTREALIAYLAPIDTAADAMLLVQATGRFVTCDRGGARPNGSSFEVQAFTQQGCDGRTRELVRVDADGGIRTLEKVVEEEADPQCVVGRRPYGLCRAETRAGRSAGHYFAESARLEGAAVLAFRRLRQELVLHQAPASLCQAARRAERDEVRHTRVAARLARSFGVQPEVARAASLPLRALEGVALDNAVEGCVRETYGVAVAHFQAARAASAPVRRAYARIAADELRHAALSFRVANWARPLLSPRAQQRLRSAERRAVATLRAELAVEPSRELQQQVGLPSSAQALALLGALERALWA